MSELANNVILFPGTEKVYIKDDPQEDTAEKNIETINRYYVNQIASSIVPQIFDQLEMSGFKVLPQQDEDEDEKFEEDTIDIMKRGVFFVEALKSIMLENYGIKHPFQELAKKILQPDPEHYGRFIFAKKIEMEIEEN